MDKKREGAVQVTRCKEGSSLKCFVNWRRALPLVEHSAPETMLWNDIAQRLYLELLVEDE
jgi:hypothetical protein